MEFWGVEIRGEKPVKVQPDIGQVVHLSQATLGELKKGGEPVVLSVRVGEQKLVIGILAADNLPQLSFDLVFEREFELSHNWKNGSVHLCGYKSYIPDEDGEEFSDFSEDEKGFLLENAENGKPALAAAVKAAKPQLAKPDNKPKEDQEDDSEDDDDDDDEDDSDDEEDESDDEDMLDAGGSGDDLDEGFEEEDDEKPKPIDAGKKRPVPAAKTPEAKKAKVATPQKTDGKKGAHTATPHPAKKAGKTPADGDKSKAQTPKSAGQVVCQTCKKTFNSENALQSHTKAKHSAGK
ncbi:hypothetical protein Ancab_007626 [Ancistrocladus abbreviatus]